MPSKLVSELLDLPETVRKSDFVLNLSAGVLDPEKTLKDYVVTPQLATCFRDALGYIRDAVRVCRSRACYLHGSFGSGKSHFMAVLYLLLQHNPDARTVPELADLFNRNKSDNHSWVEGKKFLLVPFHMIGQENMESAVLGGYVDHIRRLHPGVACPGVYLSEGLFKDAAQMRQRLGDDEFFRQLNQGRESEESSGWGNLADGWNPERFDMAINDDERGIERASLIGDLVTHFFTAYQDIASGQGKGFVNLDSGLAIISQHAKSLGYDGLILFLDELILWLASHSADLQFVQTEGQKLAKLVESQDSRRPVPIVSFVARQRDLRELIGHTVTGAEQLNFSDILGHWEGRFDMIKLEDRNLPVIAEKRILRARNDQCRKELDEAFEEAAADLKDIMDVLTTREQDRTTFRRVYPFSPALIDALVAVSSALQRERTALKIMLQLLVSRRKTLRLGEIIPLGDLWDVIVQGDEAFSDVLRINFENAKKLFHNKLYPLLEEQHKVHPSEDRDLAETDPEIAKKITLFDNDARLIKSMLLSTLVPGVDVLKKMTCSRLAALNHGTIQAFVPGREHQTVAAKIRQWASSVGEIRMSDGNDPVVSMQLSAVDTDTIIESAKGCDNPGERMRKLREMLFRSLGLPPADESTTNYAFLWRNTKRRCEIVFGNVRQMTDESLRAKDDWKLIVDYPFDTEDHTPTEDLERLDKFRQNKEIQRTIIWLPSFFSARIQGDLGKLVIIEKLLQGNILEQHSSTLSPLDRETAKTLLQNQQSSLSQKLSRALEVAYGIQKDNGAGFIDISHDIEDSHFQSLVPTLSLQEPPTHGLHDSMIHLLGQALAHQFPKHPNFGMEIKLGADLKQVLEKCRELVQTTEGRLFIDDRSLRDKLAKICNPLELATMSESYLVRDDYWKTHFNRCHPQQPGDPPTVGLLRTSNDGPEERGLPKEIQNFLIIVYADQTNRVFIRQGVPHNATMDQLPDDVMLQEQQLPDSRAWDIATTRTAEIMGIPSPQLCNATNVAELAGRVLDVVGRRKSDCERLCRLIPSVMQGLAISKDEIESCNRYRTAKAVLLLLTACENRPSLELIDKIAKAKLQTSPAAMATSLTHAKDVADCLETTQWDIFDGIQSLPEPQASNATALLDEIRDCLKTDELALSERLPVKIPIAQRKAVQLLTSLANSAPTTMPSIATQSKSEKKQSFQKIDSGSRTLLNLDDAQAEWDKILQQMKKNAKLRLNIDWQLEEEGSK